MALHFIQLLSFILEIHKYVKVCHLSNREEEMLLCDICDCGYHMDCLNPPIYTVPLEEWYCPQCEAREQVRVFDSSLNNIEFTNITNFFMIFILQLCNVWNIFI